MNITCADDEATRSTVIALAKEIGFEGVDADLGKQFAGSGFSRALTGAVTVKRKEESHD